MRALRSARLELSPPTEEDADAITLACQDPEIQRWTSIPVPYGSEHAGTFIESVEADWGATYTWAIRRGGELVGMASLFDVDDGAAEVGYWIAPNARGQGIAVEAIEAVCTFGFSDLGLQRIAWEAIAGNTASARCARRAGFAYEGCARLGIFQRGTRYDSWRAARIIDDDAQAAFASWPADVVGA